MARLLENLARSGGRSKPTALQLASGINYTQLERYLEFLESRGLVRSVLAGAREIEITPAGHAALLSLARAIRDALREEFGRGGLAP